MIEHATTLVPTSEILISSDRQRRTVSDEHINSLFSSIMNRGLIHPIVLTRDKTLVVGECRLRAWKKLEAILPDLYIPGIPARFTDEMEPDELKAIELEENIQRENLIWQEEARAFLEYYELREKQEAQELDSNGDAGSYSYMQMSGNLNCSDRHCRRMVQVGRAIRGGDPEVTACASARAAAALMDRRTSRAVENELVTFGEIEGPVKDNPTPRAELNELDLGLELSSIDLDSPLPEQVKNYSIFHADFREWSDNYTGPKFNFVHCDFPYGINLHESDLYKTQGKDSAYDDSEDLYEELCSALIYAQDSVLSKSCHIMFWFPMSKYWGTLRLFTDQGFHVEPYPLVWIKSDKTGIIPDPARGPRRIYETAFIMSLGDRKIIRPTVNGAWYSSGGQTKEHISQKPQEMLDDFFRMFIDEDSVMLDPTCGSGTSLAAALKLEAKSVMGLDINPSCVQLSEDNCRNQFTRTMKGE